MIAQERTHLGVILDDQHRALVVQGVGGGIGSG
jgi:hypothetical protein